MAEYGILNKADGRYISVIFTVAWYIVLGITFIWLVVLRKFIISISHRKFFIHKNTIRLSMLSTPLFLYPLVTYLLNSISEKWFYKNFQILNGGIVSEVHINPLPIIFGLIFLMMAGIVKEGTKLKEEQELTI